MTPSASWSSSPPFASPPLPLVPLLLPALLPLITCLPFVPFRLALCILPLPSTRFSAFLFLLTRTFLLFPFPSCRCALLCFPLYLLHPLLPLLLCKSPSLFLLSLLSLLPSSSLFSLLSSCVVFSLVSSCSPSSPPFSTLPSPPSPLTSHLLFPSSLLSSPSSLFAFSLLCLLCLLSLFFPLLSDLSHLPFARCSLLSDACLICHFSSPGPSWSLTFLSSVIFQPPSLFQLLSLLD